MIIITKKFLYIALVVITLLAGIIIGYNIPHDIQYRMDRTEDGISTIEVYDKSTGTIEYINTKFRK